MWEVYPLVGSPAFVLSLQSSFELIPKVKQESYWLSTGREGGKEVAENPLICTMLQTCGNSIKPWIWIASTAHCLSSQGGYYLISLPPRLNVYMSVDGGELIYKTNVLMLRHPSSVL